MSNKVIQANKRFSEIPIEEKRKVMDLSDKSWEDIANKYEDFDNLCPLFIDELNYLDTMQEEELQQLIDHNHGLSAMQYFGLETTVEIVEALKSEANGYFSMQQYSKAAGIYYLAIMEITRYKFNAEDPEVVQQVRDYKLKLYANSAVCEFKLKNYGRCLIAATELYKLDRTHLKAWFYIIKSLFHLFRLPACVNMVTQLQNNPDFQFGIEEDQPHGDSISNPLATNKAKEFKGVIDELVKLQQEARRILAQEQKALEAMQQEREWFNGITSKYNFTWNRRTQEVGNVSGEHEKPRVVDNVFYWTLAVVYPYYNYYQELYQNLKESVKIDTVLYEMIPTYPPFDTDRKHRYNYVECYIKNDDIYLPLDLQGHGDTFLSIIQKQHVEYIPCIYVVPKGYVINKNNNKNNTKVLI